MMKRKEALIPIAFIFIALIFLYGGIQVRTLASNAEKYGPSFFPNVCSILLLVCSVLELVGIWKNDAPDANVADRVSFRLLLIFALSCSIPVMLWAVGFIPAGILSVLLFCILIRIPWKIGLLLSVCLTFAVYCLFYWGLKVQLPTGLF